MVTHRLAVRISDQRLQRPVVVQRKVAAERNLKKLIIQIELTCAWSVLNVVERGLRDQSVREVERIVGADHQRMRAFDSRVRSDHISFAGQFGVQKVSIHLRTIAWTELQIEVCGRVFSFLNEGNRARCLYGEQAGVQAVRGSVISQGIFDIVCGAEYAVQTWSPDGRENIGQRLTVAALDAVGSIAGFGVIDSAGDAEAIVKVVAECGEEPGIRRARFVIGVCVGRDGEFESVVTQRPWRFQGHDTCQATLSLRGTGRLCNLCRREQFCRKQLEAECASAAGGAQTTVFIGRSAAAVPQAGQSVNFHTRKKGR